MFEWRRGRGGIGYAYMRMVLGVSERRETDAADRKSVPKRERLYGDVDLERCEIDAADINERLLCLVSRWEVCQTEHRNETSELKLRALCNNSLIRGTEIPTRLQDRSLCPSKLDRLSRDAGQRKNAGIGSSHVSPQSVHSPV